MTVAQGMPASSQPGFRRSGASNDWGHARPELSAAVTPATAHRVTRAPEKQSPQAIFSRAVVDWFADQVARQFSGRLLHQSQRASLLKTADRLGIDRFHANLIIAVAQHESENVPQSHFQMRPSASHFTLPRIILVVTVQGLIVWGAWRILHGI